MPPKDAPLLSVRELVVRFRIRGGTVYAVNGVSFHVAPGEVLSLVGESGCGKTTVMLSLLGLLPAGRADVTAEEMTFEGDDLLTLDESAMRRVRGARVGFIFQDPLTSLNPTLSIGRQMTETLEVHKGMSRSEARLKAIELLEAVGIPRPELRIDDFPHQFSGGMCQRAMIAMALTCEPSLLIADEPTTALDVTIQAQILELVSQLKRSRQMSMIWVTHDLGVVSDIADRVAVMYGGSLVETAPTETVLGSPQHPYTRGLLAALPRWEGHQATELQTIPGQPPDLRAPPEGCPFAPRCPFVIEKCGKSHPPLVEIVSGHHVACWWDIDAEHERS